MTTTLTPSNITAPTLFVEVANQTYAYRRFGNGAGPPLLCLQHFTGSLDNWDPAVTDRLASARQVILFDSAVLDRSSVFRRMILVGTAPRGGEDIMQLEKPSLVRYLNDPALQGYAVLQNISRSQRSW